MKDLKTNQHKEKGSRRVGRPRPKIKSPRYMEALDANLKTAKFLGNLDLSGQVEILKQLYLSYKSKYGIVETIKLLKCLHSESVRFACDLPHENIVVLWIRRIKTVGPLKGFPLVLSSFIPLLRSKSVLETRLALSLLKCYEAILIPPVEDIKSITSDSLGPANYIKIQSRYRSFLRHSNEWGTIKERFDHHFSQEKKAKVDFHYTTKKGICGPSAGTAGLQSLAIEDGMLNSISQFSNLFYEEDLRGLILENQNFYRERDGDICGISKNRALLTGTIGKFAFISDKAGKTRTVAVANYWVQNALFPFHKLCYQVLRELKCDGTFDQVSQFERVRLASSTQPVWSFDLTTATDRIPLLLDIDVVKHFNGKLGDLWEAIFTDYPFHYRNKVITYKVGQPMGLYSSWALLALGHHAIILFCARNVKIKNFDEYAIIGDDVAIWNKEVAEEYIKMMALLDVPISKLKSFVPSKLEGPCVAEFAKRISRRGVEISGISPDISIECWKSYILFPEFIAWLAFHNFSEATKCPLSRAVKLMKLTNHQVTDLVSIIHVNGLLCQPSINIEGLCVEVPTVIKDLNTQSLMYYRLMKLMNNSKEELTYTLRFKSSSEEVELEKLGLKDRIKNLAFLRILDSSTERYDKLKALFIEGNFEELEGDALTKLYETVNELGMDVQVNLALINTSNDPSLGYLELRNTLKTIEYLPPANLGDLIKGQMSHDKTYVLRGRYVRDMMKLITRTDRKRNPTLSLEEAVITQVQTLRMISETIYFNRRPRR